MSEAWVLKWKNATVAHDKLNNYFIFLFIITMEEMFLPLQLESKIDDLSFELYDPTSDSVVEKKLSDYQDKWIVFVFYPADFTFVCPTELKDLGKVQEKIKAQNGELFVVSTDTVFSHKRRVETEKLLEGFWIPMISDRTTDLSLLFGVLNEKTGNAERGSFIISPDRVLKSIEVVTEPIGRSSEELVRKLTALEFVRSNPGQACPASWNTGWKTLTPSIDIAGKVAEFLK